MAGLRVAFLGNAAWSVPPLRALARSPHRPVLVLTRVPRPAGRGSRLRPTPVAGAAHEMGVPLREVETVKSGPGFDALGEAAPEVLVVVAYGEILPPAVLALPSIAPVNLHFSLLPALRGAAPVQHALLQGLQGTGVTTMVMDEGLDTGPILLQRATSIAPGDDAGSLGDRLAEVGGGLLVRTLDGLGAGALAATPQDHHAATYAPKLRREDEWLDWNEPAESIVRRVRALAPDPAGSSRFRGEVLKVLRAREDSPAGSEQPGAILLVDGEGVVVAAGVGAVRLLDVAPAGRRRMTAAEFARGHRPAPGEVLEGPGGG